jgi:hypothetical protein
MLKVVILDDYANVALRSVATRFEGSALPCI